MTPTQATDGFPGIHILEETPRILNTVLRGVAPEDLDWQPAPDRWSISMVLAHLADVEVRGFVSRFRAMANEDNAFLPVYDQLDLFRDGRSFDGMAELRAFERLRGENIGWLRTLPASVLGRRGRHEQLGEITFKELLNEFAFHDLGHIRQVMELYRSRVFYPQMGGFRRYYEIKP
jgi:hypothetical protein